MTAYLIADITVTDQTAYDRYRAAVPAVIAAHGGRYIVRGGAIENAEGDLGLNRVVILAFADMATLKAFYDSPAYAPLKAIRSAASHSRVAFIEGYDG